MPIVPRLYLSGSREFRPELRRIRDELAELGVEVRARWLDEELDYVKASQAELASAALSNWEDIRLCDVFISYQPVHSTGSGGAKHCEFGLALAFGMPIVVLGKREHLYQCLPQVTHLITFRSRNLADAVIGMKRHLMKMRGQAETSS